MSPSRRHFNVLQFVFAAVSSFFRIPVSDHLLSGTDEQSFEIVCRWLFKLCITLGRPYL